MNESSPEKRHQEIQRSLKTPCGRIVITAYTYSSMGNEVARQQYPIIAGWPNAKSLGNLLQVATILSTLLRIERHLGPRDYSAFHLSIVAEFASSVRHIYVPPIQGLACFLLQIDRSSLSADEIPPLTRLLTGDETRLANSIGLWLVLTLKGIETLSEPADIEAASALTYLAYHKNAKMISDDVLGDENLLKAIA